MAEKFNDAEPLLRDRATVAEIEKDEQYVKGLGQVWLDSNWFTVEQARELRDWLNKVIP